ncbi:MAG: efflux RND transporter permease subunit [Ruminococcus sp.]|nr:efflux RND transporter permease subunit [Ruminococcus sp.]
MFSKFSVKKPFTVLVCVIVVVVLGIVSFTKMVPDLLPSMNLPYAIVMTTYVGASPEEVEETVTRPIEQSMASMNNINNISSTSSENVSLVILEFNDDANMDSITVDMRESLDTIASSWSDSIGNPIIMKLNPDMMPVMVSALSVDGMSIQEISDYANDTLIPTLESVDGVGSVSASGLLEESINVVIRQEKVDEINKKLKQSVSNTLDDAKEQLDDAKEELSESKMELEEALEQFNDGMIEGSQTITESRFEILKNEIKLADTQEELSAKEEELLEGLAEIEASEKTLNETELALTEGETQLIDGIAQIDDAIAQMDTQLEQLNLAKSQIMNEAINQIETMMEGTVSGIGSSIATDPISQMLLLKQLVEQLDLDPTQITDLSSFAVAIQSKLTEIDDGISTINSAKEELSAQRDELSSKLEEVQSAMVEVASGKEQLLAAKTQALEGQTALNEAKEQLEEGSSQLDDAKTQLNEGEAELEKTKNDTGKELNDGLDAINTAEEQLDEQLDSWDDTVEQALDSASVEDTITVDMISQILQAQNFSMPAGYVTEEGVDYLIKVGDKIDSVEELKNLVLFDLNIDGLDPITLQDVADVFLTDNSDSIYASVDGEDGIILTFQKQNGYSTAEVAENLLDKFESISEEDSSISFVQLMNQGDYIDLIVDSVIENLLEGAIFAIIVLFLFLKDWRPTLIVACSIPISVIFAIGLMYFSGISLNIISLSGLAIGVGMLVDNSVVVIENVYRIRHLGKSAIQSSVSGAKQVAGAITSSTLTTICVFAPIVFVEGLTKTLFVDMALTIAYSLTTSLIVSLTVVPALTSRMLTTVKEVKTPIFDRLRGIYAKALEKVLNLKAVALILVVAMLGISAYGAVSRGVSFMPDMDSTQISVSLTMPDGSILDETIETSNDVMEKIQNEIEEVDTIGAMLSGGMASTLGIGGDTSETEVSMYVILKEDKKRTSQEIATQINTMFEDSDFELSASGSSMDLSALGGSGITINIKGSELDTLQTIATDISEILSTVEGVGEVDDGMENPSPQLKITVDKEKAMLNGLTVAQIYMELAGEISTSSTATQISLDGKTIDIIVDKESTDEVTRESIKNHKFTVTDNDAQDDEDSSSLLSDDQNTETPTKEIKLTDIATVEDGVTLSSIGRENQTRYISVTGTIADGYNVGLVTNDAQDVLQDYEVPEGYEVEFAGENETIMEAMEQLALMLLLAILLIYLIMVAQFQSLKSPFIVMFTMPLAFTGGFLGLLITGKDLSVISVIGFVMLSGIVVNNGIVLVDYINQLRLEGMDKKEAIIEAGSTRLRPILMTAITTILGLVMMAVGNGMGSDMMQPIAIVTIGGLIYATFTTLFIIPIIYDIFNKKPMKKIDNSELDYIED